VVYDSYEEGVGVAGWVLVLFSSAICEESGIWTTEKPVYVLLTHGVLIEQIAFYRFALGQEGKG
jgi:hypothetical protein